MIKKIQFPEALLSTLSTVNEKKNFKKYFER